MRHRALALASTLAVSLAAGTAPWEPIPAQVWALKDDPAKVAKGAVFVEERLSLANRAVARSWRIRILSEAGRAAAEFPSLPDSAFDVQGRTVYPDGREVPFNSKKDFQTKAVVAVAGESVNRTVIVPPGVTGDCVVEFRYKEFYDFPKMSGYSFGTMRAWDLAEAYPVDRYVLEVQKPFAWSWSFQPIYGVKFERFDGRDSGGFVLTNIPAYEPPPYSLAPTRAVCRLVSYPIPPWADAATRQGNDAYWVEVASAFRRWHEAEIRKGWKFKEFSAEILKGLPAEGRAAATELWQRLEARIHNLDHLTFQEVATIKKVAADDLDNKNYEEVVKRGSTDSDGMRFLFIELLKMAGHTPVVGLVADRDVCLFNPKQPNFQQFTHLLVGVDPDGKGVLWFDPSLRYAQPGLVNPDYQGTTVMAMPTKDWMPKFQQIPAQAADFNQRTYTYRLELGDGEDRFKVEAAFAGWPEFRERWKYAALEPAAESKELKQRLERDFKTVTVEKAEVRNAQDPRQPVAWTAEGVQEREASRRRVVEPFPLMYLPLNLPDKMDGARREAIVLPHQLTFRAESTFKVPAGYRIGGVEPFDQENGFGKVHWEAAPRTVDGATEVKVVLRVDVNTLVAPPSETPAFRRFLDWVREVSSRQLVLEK